MATSSDEPTREQRAVAWAEHGVPPREALAGFWRRFAAAFIDWLLLSVLASALGALFGVETVAREVMEPNGTSFRVGFNASSGLLTLVELAYFTYFHATTAGQSIGNKILGIRVLDANTGRPLTPIRAFVRALMSYVSAIALLLGYFWMLWDRRKQTWHDKVAESLVVRANVYPPGEFGRLAR